MTRINVISPALLLDEHLIAELREINRVPNAVISGKAKIDLKKIPGEYTLGTGHVIFHYNKLEYIRKRYDALYKEAQKRGFNVQCYQVDYDAIPGILRPALMQDYTPTAKAMHDNLERICERFDLRKKAYHFHRVKIDNDHDFNRYLKIIEKQLDL